MKNNDVLTFLDWDSKFFNKRIGRVNASRLTDLSIKSVFALGKSQKLDCLYFLCESDDSESPRIAESYGFFFVDLRVTMEWNYKYKVAPPESLDTKCSIRRFIPEDLDPIKTIAGSSHEDSRFFYDPHFPDNRCARMYEMWIENSCISSDWNVFVGEINKTPVGYITCKMGDGENGVIGLMGVSGKNRGQGVGHQLMGKTLEWFAGQGTKNVSVVTQGRNLSALRFYERNGFLIKNTQIWFHKWFSGNLT